MTYHYRALRVHKAKIHVAKPKTAAKGHKATVHGTGKVHTSPHVKRIKAPRVR